jgi:hypothetical protein
MFEAPFLQSVICPLCRYTENEAEAFVEQLHGTGFFMGSSGFFVTAKHVLEEAFEDAKRSGGRVGIFPNQMVDGDIRSLTVPIDAHEFAPPPFDVAVGKTEYFVNSFLKPSKRVVEVWQDVATTGYAAELAGKEGPKYEAQQRAQKGYIQRVIPKGRIKIGNYPACFETSFPITQGSSGAPLFVSTSEGMDVIGVCVGSLRSEIVDFAHSEVTDGDKTFSEKSKRILEVGIANDLLGLLDWTPEILGKSLEAI